MKKSLSTKQQTPNVSPSSWASQPSLWLHKTPYLLLEFPNPDSVAPTLHHCVSVYWFGTFNICTFVCFMDPVMQKPSSLTFWRKLNEAKIADLNQIARPKYFGAWRSEKKKIILTETRLLWPVRLPEYIFSSLCSVLWQHVLWFILAQ